MAGSVYLKVNGESVKKYVGLDTGGQLTNIETLYDLCYACEANVISDVLADSLIKDLQVTEKVSESKFEVIEKAFAEDKRTKLKEKIQVEHIPAIPAWKKVLLKTGIVLFTPFRVVVETVTLPFKLLLDTVVIVLFEGFGCVDIFGLAGL